MGTQLAGKTLGIVGLGRIGQAVATRAKAFEMRVVGYDPFLPGQRAKELGIETVATVHELLPMVDYLTVHTPLTEQTRSLIGAKEIEMLRPTARLINCARGGIYDEAALAEAVKNGRIAGVALDVFEKEPCTSSPLFGLPGVLATPHLGASTEEAQTNVAVEGVGLLIDFLTTGAVRHAVNMTPVDPKTMASLRGYLDVAYRLGLLLAQLDRSAPTACKLSYRGEVTSKETKLITASFAAGLLQNAMAEEVNIVNAELLLRERGIELTEESCGDIGDFSSVIAAEVTTEGRTIKASGTLFGKKMPRLVKIDDYNLETYLDGILMVFTHHDVPGIIGKVGSTFGTHRVNIAQMSVGRTSKLPGGMALGVLNLDAEPTAAALAEVRAEPQVESVSVIKLPPAGELPAWLAE
jgi:D-3-phosphoglycerate dehydrogenase / 2-oxoglutarate reductase